MALGKIHFSKMIFLSKILPKNFELVIITIVGFGGRRGHGGRAV
jgi:hypothetical protein